MRIQAIAGVALIVIGLLFLFGVGLTSSRDVMQVGSMTVTAEESHPVRPWIAGIVLLAGVGLVALDVRGKS